MIKDIKNIKTGNLKLDGGSIFGVVPKTLWSKVYESDGDNRIVLAMNCMLIDTGHRVALIDNGMGEKQDEKFKGIYWSEGEDNLSNSLKQAGYNENDITDVIMTHLHFDHCGGGTKRSALGDGFELTFPNATYYTGKAQWENAMQPNAREKSSFLKENLNPIGESGRLELITKEMELFPGLSLRFSNGHTSGQLIPFIQFKNRTIVFVADLIPTAAHVRLPWITAYDMQPLEILEEKESLLKEALENNYILFFEHDLYTECVTLKNSEKGIVVDKRFDLVDLDKN